MPLFLIKIVVYRLSEMSQIEDFSAFILYHFEFLAIMIGYNFGFLFSLGFKNTIVSDRFGHFYTIFTDVGDTNLTKFTWPLCSFLNHAMIQGYHHSVGLISIMLICDSDL